MKRIMYIYLIAVITLTGGFQSCFQDMDNNPAFDYPPNYVPEYRPLKFHLPFEGNLDDVDNHYRLNIGSSENIAYVDGVKGKACQGGEKTFVTISLVGSYSDTIANLGSFTVAFWMNSEPNKSVTGLFSIARKDQAQGYIDIWLENNGGTSNQALIKGYMRNIESGTEKTQWIDVGGTTPEGSSRIDNVFNKWTHIAFRYNGETSSFSIFKDGEPVLNNKIYTGFGPLVFDADKVGAIVIGAFPGQAGASTATPSWVGTTYLGKFDEYRFYNKAMSDEDIKSLYTNKE